ncbi:MAG: helix-turn-helix domain-containing protein [Streptosporangiaceae bacterium]
MSQNSWSAEFAKLVGGQVKRWRTERGISAQKLADRCADLGMEIPRAVLANLENGRRPVVQVTELLILAAALEVPPVVLIAPLGSQADIEILPGRTLTTRDAVLWLSGQTHLSEDPSDNATEWLSVASDKTIVPMYEYHDRMLEELEAIPTEGPVLTDAEGNVISDSAQWRRETISRLREHRALMRQRGLLLPPLPADLENIDSEPRAGRRVHRQARQEGGS